MLYHELCVYYIVDFLGDKVHMSIRQFSFCQALHIDFTLSWVHFLFSTYIISTQCSGSVGTFSLEKYFHSLVFIKRATQHFQENMIQISNLQHHQEIHVVNKQGVYPHSMVPIALKTNQCAT
jgi:hypothetical protein